VCAALLQLRDTAYANVRQRTAVAASGVAEELLLLLLTTRYPALPWAKEWAAKLAAKHDLLHVHALAAGQQAAARPPRAAKRAKQADEPASRPTAARSRANYLAGTIKRANTVVCKGTALGAGSLRPASQAAAERRFGFALAGAATAPAPAPPPESSLAARVRAAASAAARAAGALPAAAAAAGAAAAAAVGGADAVQAAAAGSAASAAAFASAAPPAAEGQAPRCLVGGSTLYFYMPPDAGPPVFFGANFPAVSSTAFRAMMCALAGEQQGAESALEAARPSGARTALRRRRRWRSAPMPRARRRAGRTAASRRSERQGSAAASSSSPLQKLMQCCCCR
jgi:hypothetical protein